MVMSVPFSMPLLTQTMGTCCGSQGSVRFITSRVAWLGMARTTNSAPSSASESSPVARTRSLSGIPGK